MRQTVELARRLLCLAVMLCAGTVIPAAQATDNRVLPADSETSALVAQLGSRSPQTRQSAAEELARRADTEQLKLVEGYRMQEKDGRVKVALDWALYRMGKSESLFALVRALDSTHGDQAAAYLTALDSPQPLYIFLNRTKRVAQVRLLEILGEIGDAETLDKIKPALESLEPTIAVAAENATEQINTRLGQPSAVPPTPTRPRQVGTVEDAAP